MANPFFTLQSRLADLLRADAYFTALPADAILTELVQDIESKITESLLPLGFGVVITTAKGDGVSSLGVVTSTEAITVAIIHNPTLDPAHNLLDALYAAVRAIAGQPVIAGREVRRAEDTFRYTGHVRRMDAPDGIDVHHLFITAQSPLL